MTPFFKLKSIAALFFVILSSTVFGQSPAITSFSPSSGIVGTVVTITGTNFNTVAGNNIVFFGATKATVTAATATSLTVTVPGGAVYGPITELNTGTQMAAYSRQFFSPVFSPAMSSITTADFSPNVNFPTGSNPGSAAIGDLDGDGKPDVAVANQGSNTVSVMLNTGSGFAMKVDLATGAFPGTVAIGDIDGDGKPDLVTANVNSNNVSVLRNTSSIGSISFAMKADFTVGTSTISAAICDLDGDGKPDLATANPITSTVSVLRNTSLGSTIGFAEKVDISTGTSTAPRSIAIGDLNGDGKPDLVVANSMDASVSSMHNKCTIGIIDFGNFRKVTTGDLPHSVAIGDIDGDGKLDVITANTNSNTVSVLRNITTANAITLAAKADFATGEVPESVAVGDFDGDGKPEVSVANFRDNTVSVLRNTSSSGSISFVAKADMATGVKPYSIAIVDLDGDGKSELVTPSYGSDNVSVVHHGPVSTSITSIERAGGETVNAGTVNYTVNFGTVIFGAGLSGLSASNFSLTTTGGITGASIGSISGTGSSYTTTVNTGSGNGTITLNLNNATGLSAGISTTLPFSGQVYTIDKTAPVVSSVAVPTNGTYRPNQNLDFTVNFGEAITVTTGGGTPYINLTLATGGTVRADYTSGSGGTALTFRYTVSAGNLDEDGIALGSTITANGGTLRDPGGNDATLTLNSIALTTGVLVDGRVPVISSFSPATGSVGTLVTITGTDLSSPTAITIGGTTAIVVSNTGTSLVAMVMPGAVDGVISITTSGGTATSGSNFTLAPALVANSQQGLKLVGSNGAGMARQGSAVALSADGSTAAVGGTSDNSGIGAIWIWIRTGEMWVQQGLKLVGSSVIGKAGLGWSLALSKDGNTLIVGGLNDDSNKGAAWVFTRSGVAWTQQSKLVGTGAGVNPSFQGSSVDISADGNTAIVGAYDDNSGAGAAWIWIRSGGTWTEQGLKLVGSNAVGKAKQGKSVALSADGNTAMLGGTNDNTNIGAVWVFIRSNGAWTQQGEKLVGTSGVSPQGSGIALSADGNTAIIGGAKDPNNPGAAWFWTRSGTTWTQQGDKIAVTASSVAMSAEGNVAIAGDITDNGTVGALYVYKRTDGIWTQSHKLIGSGGSYQGGASAISADGSTIMSGGSFDASLKGAAWAFNYMPPPTITSFSPANTVGGTTVTITGTNFTGATAVKFGGTAAASFTVVSATSITAVVGSGSNGDVTVTSSRGTATLAGFTILPPSITSFSPASGPVGTLVTVTGNNLNNASVLSIGGKNAIVVSSTGTSLSALVMPGTTDGIISLTTGGGTVTSGSNFTITAAKSLSSQQKIATGGPAAISLGVAVAVSADGNTAVVGAPGENADQGAAWVYTRSGSGWIQEAKLVGTVNSRAARQGSSVSISADGNTVIMGGGTTATTSRGALWFFTRSNGVWSEQGTQVVTLSTAPTPSHDFSTSLSADGNTALAGAFGDGNNRGALWVYVRTAGTWTQQGSKLLGSGNITFFPRSGFSVSLSADGNTALMGGDGDDSGKGAAWVFTRTGTTWTEQTKLVGTQNTGASKQGSSVSLSADGNIALIGGPADNANQGAVWVFSRSGSTWTQQTVLTGNGAAKLGSSVSMNADGTIAIIGGEDDNSGQGAAWMYTRTGNTWTQNGTKLSGAGGIGSSHQGHSISLSADGNSAVIGGNADDSGKGAAWVFTPIPPPVISSFTTVSGPIGSIVTITGTDLSNPTAVTIGGVAPIIISNTGTSLVAMVMPGATTGIISLTTAGGTANSSTNFRIVASAIPNSPQGSKLPGDGTGSIPRRGASVSVSADGNTAIVGEIAGAWIYTRSGTTWTKHTSQLVGSQVSGSINYAAVSISADGNTAIVGGYYDDSGKGAIWFFTRSGNTWTQQGNKFVVTGASSTTAFGTSVALSADGNTAISGAPGGIGAAYIFKRTGGTWSQQDKLVGTGSVSGGQFGPAMGQSVALNADGNTAIIGGPNDNNGIGAVWIFTRTADTWAQQGNKFIGANYIGKPSFGGSVSLSAEGNTAIIGGARDNGSTFGVGAAWIFTRSGTTWTQQGNKLIGTGAIGNSSQGNAVSLSADGNIAMVGGYLDNESPTFKNPGAVWVYSRNTEGAWTQQGNKLVDAGRSPEAKFGGAISLSADGNTAVIGGPSDNNQKGSVWFYTYSPPPTISSFTPAHASFGSTVTITGTNLSGVTAVNFGGVPAASYTVVSESSVTAVVGVGSSGDVSASTMGGATATLGGFTMPLPVVNSLTPLSGPVGTLFTISGTDLAGASAVKIGGTPAIIISNTSTTLVAMAMPGSTTGTVSVTTLIATATSDGRFTITPAFVPNSQQGAKLTGTGNTGAAEQGRSVSLSADGNTAIIGGYMNNGGQGAVWIYTRSGNSWTQQGNRLLGTGNSGAAKQGYAVALSADGNTAVVGGYADFVNKGAIWIWVRNGSTWTAQGVHLLGSPGGKSSQGYSVSISADGNTVLAGAPTGTDNGTAWIWNRNGSVWTELASGRLLSTESIGAAKQGYSVSLSADGNTAILGGNADNADAGASWIWIKNGIAWVQQTKLIGIGNIGAAKQGSSVSLSADGNTAIVGGPGDNSGQGAVWIWTRTGTTWTQQSKLVGTGNTGAAAQGYSVSLSADGNTAIVGGNVDNMGQGNVWVYTRSGATWTQQEKKLTGTGGSATAAQGTSVALSADGNTAMTGGPGDNTNQGAAWVFTHTSPPVITSFTPLSAATGSTVALTGSDFTGTTEVSFGGITAASFTVVSPTSITAVLGAGASGALSITTPYGSGSLAGFTFLSSNADLSALALSNGTLNPVFDAGLLEYTSSVSNAVSSIIITPTAAGASATVKVNGTSVASGSASEGIDLSVGANTITSEVTAADGTTVKTYTLVITRAPSSNADLSVLSLSNGILHPVFHAATLEYTASVGNAITSINVIPTLADASATVKVNGMSVNGGSTSENINLAVGANTITAEVIAQDGTTTKTYTLVITRIPSSNADLLTLALSAGTLDPVFAAGTVSYTAYISHATSSITLEPGAANTNASINVNGIPLISGTTSGNIALIVGNNNISIAVRSQDGAITKTYTIKVIRLGSDQVLPDQSGDALVNNTVTQVVVVSPTQPVLVTVPAGTSTSPSIDYGDLIKGGTGTVPQTTVNSAFAQLMIPAATEVTALGTGWDGVLSTPAITTYDLPQVAGQTITTGLIIEVGSPDYSLSFNKAVRLTLTGQAGMRIARVHNNIYKEILLTGSEDSQAAGDELPADGTFKIDVGADMVIWTKVFSKYITFSQITDLNVALVEGDKAELTADMIRGANADLSSIKSSLILPTTGTFGSSITWTSSDPAVVSTDGKTIVRSLSGSGNRSATVTATIKKGLITEMKSFNLIIPELPNQAPTLTDIASRAICYTTAFQSVSLTGISPGPESGQTTVITVASDKPAMFNQLSLTGNTLNYKLNDGVSGVATITVTVKDNGGIADGGSDTYTRTFSVTVNPLPVAFINSNLGAEISKGLTANLNASGGTTYVWATAAGIISGQQTSTLVVRPSVTTIYTVTATSQAGCSISASFTLVVKDDLLALDINNIMSPNGDAVNDYLVIKNLDMYPNNTLKVFDREGRQLYAKTNYTNDWDGSFNGSPLEEDTYFYIVDFGPGITKLKGFVSIVR